MGDTGTGQGIGAYKGRCFVATETSAQSRRRSRGRPSGQPHVLCRALQCRASAYDEGAITLAIRAKRFIKRHEAILVHYNPEEGIASWKHVFKCACCRCFFLKGQCNECSTSEARGSVQQAKHEGVSDARGMIKGDFLRTHLNDFWGNIVEVTNDDVKVKGFCITAKRILTKRIQADNLQRDDRAVRWHGASRILRRCAIARIWTQACQSAGAKGGWLEDETVDSAVRWSLYGNTNVAGLAPCSARNGIPVIFSAASSSITCPYSRIGCACCCNAGLRNQRIIAVAFCCGHGSAAVMAQTNQIPSCMSNTSSTQSLAGCAAMVPCFPGCCVDGQKWEGV